MSRFSFLPLLFLAMFAVTTFAQNSVIDNQWSQFKDDKLSFSISFPSEYVIDNEIPKSSLVAPVEFSLPEVIDYFEKPKIISSQRSATLSLSIFQLPQAPDAKKYLWYFLGPVQSQDRYQDFKIGDFAGRKIDYSTDTSLSTSIIIAVSNKVLVVRASAKNEDREIYEKFLMSVNIEGNSLFGASSAAALNPNQAMTFSTLQTSPEVIESLNKGVNKSSLKIIKTDNSATEEKDERKFSRSLIILRKPTPNYNYAFVRDKISLKIRLKVLFLSNGQIGSIALADGTANDNFTESAIKAVQKMKFLPAEIDGKKVEVSRIVEYSFTSL
jgi:TonB family protein